MLGKPSTVSSAKSECAQPDHFQAMPYNSAAGVDALVDEDSRIPVGALGPE